MTETDTAIAPKWELHIQIDDTKSTAADLLALKTGLSKQRVKQAMQKGAVWVTRGKKTTRLRRSTKSLKLQDEIHLYYDESILATEPTPCRLISDEEAYSVWYKPFGLRSQGSRWGDHCTIHRWVELNMEPQRPTFIVHRLDRAATGLMLIAHRKGVATQLAKLFEGRLIIKLYQAVVHGEYPIDAPARSIESEIDGRTAKSRVSGIQYDPSADRSLVDVAINTGRKHQIRRHLSEIGFPVVGDRLYGRKEDRLDLQLAATQLAFESPIDSENRTYRLPGELMLSLSKK